MVRRSRKNARVACAIEGRILGTRGYQKGTVHNLSTGGLFFSVRNLAVGDRAELEFTLDDHAVHATCEILYRQGGDAPGIGVRFLRINASSVERIRRYLSSVEQAAS